MVRISKISSLLWLMGAGFVNAQSKYNVHLCCSATYVIHCIADYSIPQFYLQ